MEDSVSIAYCGPPGLGLRNLVGIRAKGNLYSYFEGKNVIYVHKGRTAIKIACDILGLGKNSEVLAPSYNCGSEIDPLLSSGALVVLYRVDKNAAIDIEDLERKITDRTKAIYITHYFGFPHPLEEIKKICVKNNLYLMEDCALALFSWHDNAMMGTMGDIGIFSLPKSLPVPDGGLLLINNAALLGPPLSLSRPKWADIFVATLPSIKATMIRWLSSYSVFNQIYNRYATNKNLDGGNHAKLAIQAQDDMPQSYYYNHKYSNKIMSSFTQCLIKTYRPRDIVLKRRHNYRTLDSLLKNHPGLSPLYNELPDQVCPLCYPLLVEDRDAMAKELSRQSIDARGWWRGFHKMLPWAEFPEASFLKKHLLTLPVHQDLSEAALEYMARCFKQLK